MFSLKKEEKLSPNYLIWIAVTSVLDGAKSPDTETIKKKLRVQGARYYAVSLFYQLILARHLSVHLFSCSAALWVQQNCSVLKYAAASDNCIGPAMQDMPASD